MMNEEMNRVFIGPILSLLRSRKFMVALMTVIVDVVIAFTPPLETARAELLTVFTVVGTALVAAIAYEDGQQKGGVGNGME